MTTTPVTSPPTVVTLEAVCELAAAASRNTRARDDGIRALRAQGLTIRAIADGIGLSSSAVAKIAARR